MDASELLYLLEVDRQSMKEKDQDHHDPFEGYELLLVNKVFRELK
jgi:hypothetical protein